ncbi:MAG: DUF1634 domain-containing protein [Elusimicrobiota bacterium]|nr:DUF1634 domain-containing protein [Elusimicrobiota bacterium]
MTRPRDPASVAVAAALKGGVTLALGLLAAGLAAAALRGQPLPTEAVELGRVLPLALAGDAAGLLSLGLLALLATPAVRVTVLAYQFARAREWRMLAVTALVLAVLAFSLLSGRGEA